MRLGVWQRSAVYATTVTVGTSGLIWFVAHDFFNDASSDVTRAMLSLHGFASYALLVVLGSLLPLHVRSGWRHRRNILTGIASLTTMAILGGTALVLYYGSEETHAPARWVHLGLGLFVILLLPIHAFRQNRRQTAPPCRPRANNHEAARTSSPDARSWNCPCDEPPA